MLDSHILFQTFRSFKMDSRISWIIFIFCVIGSTRGALQARNMTDCLKGGLKCSRYGSCRFDTTSSDLTCICVAGFKGHLCEEDRNECDIGSAPCKRRGVCHNSIGSFRCDCVPGWQGSHCQIADGTGLTMCPTGYTGVKCTDDFDECTQWTENPCEHGSTCVNTPGNFTCYCTTGWGSRICNEDINECNVSSGLCHNGGNCTNIPGSYTCECPYPYTGTTCDDVSTTTSTPTHSPNSTKDDNSDGSKGSTNIWVIVGPVVGILVIAAVCVGIFVYHKCYRESHKVNAGDETEVRMPTQENTTAESKNQTK